MVYLQLPAQNPYVCGMKNASSGKKRVPNAEWLRLPPVPSTSPPMIPVPVTKLWILPGVATVPIGAARRGLVSALAIEHLDVAHLRQNEMNVLKYLTLTLSSGVYCCYQCVLLTIRNEVLVERNIHPAAVERWHIIWLIWIVAYLA